MVERRDDERHVFAHIRLAEPRAFEHLFGGIGQVRGEHVVDHALGIRLVKRLQAAGEERERRAREHALGLAPLEVIRQIEDGVAGSDDVVGHEHILALHAVAQILVRDDRVAAVDHAGVIAALVEHAHVHAHRGAVIDVAVERALVRGNDHHVMLVDAQIIVGGHKNRRIYGQSIISAGESVMNLTEKISYIRGLCDGLELDESKPEVKVLNAIVDLLDDMAFEVSDMEELYDELSAQVDEIDQDLADVESDDLRYDKYRSVSSGKSHRS